jgi:hypothetical protein
MAKIIIKDTIKSLVSFYVPKMRENYLEELKFTIHDNQAMTSYDFIIYTFKSNCDSYFVIAADFDKTDTIRQSILIDNSEFLDIDKFVNKVISFINRETDYDHNKTTTFYTDSPIMIHIDNMNEFFDYDDTIVVDKYKIIQN